MRLADKVILITGSCTGIGRAMARQFVAEGARVIINGLDEEPGVELVRELGTKNAVLLVRDITLPYSPELLVQLAVDTFGKLDAVVNNAALILSSEICTTDTALLHRMLAVNTVAPFAIIKAALSQLSANKGVVLNIGSVNAWCGEPDLLAYSISKGALMTLTRNLGDSLFRTYGVRVNQINPGWVLTEKEILNKREQGMKENWYQDLPSLFAPAGRLLAPQEIASAAVYLLSDECGPVSGQVLDLDQYPFMGRNLPKDVIR
jgi:NAD(P)-dependent dehydrogenase (short-subunit alcohol dehydrogenase family)